MWKEPLVSAFASDNEVPELPLAFFPETMPVADANALRRLGSNVPKTAAACAANSGALSGRGRAAASSAVPSIARNTSWATIFGSGAATDEFTLPSRNPLRADYRPGVKRNSQQNLGGLLRR